MYLFFVGIRRTRIVIFPPKTKEEKQEPIIFGTNVGERLIFLEPFSLHLSLGTYSSEYTSLDEKE
jgi:hypothetical protein